MVRVTEIKVTLTNSSINKEKIISCAFPDVFILVFGGKNWLVFHIVTVQVIAKKNTIDVNNNLKLDQGI